MANKKISAMPDAAALTGAELLPLIQSGGNVKDDLNTLIAFICGHVQSLRNANGAGITFSGNGAQLDDSTLARFTLNGDGSISIADSLGIIGQSDGLGIFTFNQIPNCAGFSGTVSPITSITVQNGIVTDVS